jgi:hypothetical protein
MPQVLHLIRDFSLTFGLAGVHPREATVRNAIATKIILRMIPFLSIYGRSISGPENDGMTMFIQ